MNNEQRIWKAIEESLYRYGDSDLRAGLAWLNEEQKLLIAKAAIEAITAAKG